MLQTEFLSVTQLLNASVLVCLCSRPASAGLIAHSGSLGLLESPFAVEEICLTRTKVSHSSLFLKLAEESLEHIISHPRKHDTCILSRTQMPVALSERKNNVRNSGHLDFSLEGDELTSSSSAQTADTSSSGAHTSKPSSRWSVRRLLGGQRTSSLRRPSPEEHGSASLVGSERSHASPKSAHDVHEPFGLAETASTEDGSVLDQLKILVHSLSPSKSASTPILRGTLDRDETVEVVYYDAAQDSQDLEQVKQNHQSIVIDNVLGIPAGGASSYPTANDFGIEMTPEMIRSGQVGAPVSNWAAPIWKEPPLPPQPPKELPLRFLRAGKGDPVEGMRRYEDSLKWRRENRIDNILREANPNFATIKKYYPHFCHRHGRNGEPCYYEQPPKARLKTMISEGVSMDNCMRHYLMVTEFQWQFLYRDDLMRSIYIIDCEGMRFNDFVGDVVEFVKRASKLSSQHYPERAGFVFVINVPAWFNLIWKVIKPWIDEATLSKIHILRDKGEIRRKMEERIPLENIPPEYGGTSMPLGHSPEEQLFARLVAHNNALARGDRSCGGVAGGCMFCSWRAARSY